MPEISRFYGLVISMFHNDHNPPHFHVRYGGNKAKVSISTLEILAGKLPRRAQALVLEWASTHRSELLENWERAMNDLPLKDIDPLE
jgi:hypothetical protein